MNRKLENATGNSDRPISAMSETGREETPPKQYWILQFALAAITLLLCGGMAPIVVQAPFHLLMGWLFFVSRTIPEININAWQCVFGMLLVAGSFAMLLFLGRSLGKDNARLWNARHAGLAMLFVVASFVVGLGATGVAHQIGWLLRGGEPLIDGIGEAAQRMTDSNRQKQMVVAAQEYAAKHDNAINPTKFGDDGELLHGWQTALLPYLDEQAVYQQIDQGRSWNHRVNREPLATPIDGYLGPFRDEPVNRDALAVTHYTGNALVFGDSTVRRLEDVTDGLGHTIFSGNASGNYAAWGHPANWRDPRLGINRSKKGFGSPFHGGSHVVMGDGAVLFITDSIDPEVLRALSTPRGGEEVDEF